MDKLTEIAVKANDHLAEALRQLDAEGIPQFRVTKLKQIEAMAEMAFKLDLMTRQQADSIVVSARDVFHAKVGVR